MLMVYQQRHGLNMERPVLCINYTTSTQTVSGSSDTTVSLELSMHSLPVRIGTPYTFYYTIAAQNSVGTSYGGEKSFESLIHTDCPCSVSGKVTDAITKEGIKNAIISEKSSLETSLTNVDGSYSWWDTSDNCRSGNSYTLTVLADGYLSSTQSVTFGESSCEETLNFELQPEAISTPTPDPTPISTPAPCEEGIILETYKATDVTLDSATLNGLIGGEFSFRGNLGFEYGTSSGSYTNGIGIEGVEAGQKSVRVNGLLAGTTYYYRIYKYRYEIVPDFTPCYSYGNEEVFTTLTCEAKSVSVSPKRLILQRRENSEVTVALQSDNCVPEGNTVIATIGKAGSRRISISSASEVTDENGEARFTITAKDKIGKAKVAFKSGSVKKAIIVKVVRQ